MTYSTFLHSSLVNPAKPNITREDIQDPVDTVTLDIPLLTRILELSREEVKTDADLHDLITRILELKNRGVLSMNDYDHIAGIKGPEKAELESILKLAGMK